MNQQTQILLSFCQTPVYWLLNALHQQTKPQTVADVIHHIARATHGEIVYKDRSIRNLATKYQTAGILYETNLQKGGHTITAFTLSPRGRILYEGL